MGRYFNPANRDAILKAGGQSIIFREFDMMLANVPYGSSLALHVFRNDRGFPQVVDVTYPPEFDEFRRQIGDGTLELLGVYSLPDNAFQPTDPYPPRKPRGVTP